MKTTMSTTMEPYTVPTKQADESERPTANVVEETQEQHEDDAFSRYSNDLLRMKAILLLSDEDQDLETSDDDDDDDDDLDALASINRALSSLGMTNITHLNQDNNERRRGNNSRRIQQGNVRKTTLSWELHPILIDALDDDNGAHRIPGDDDEGDGSDESTERQAPNQVQHQEE
jgi:hypothetical protein